MARKRDIMKKYHFLLDECLFRNISMPIRDRVDIVKLLLQTIKYISVVEQVTERDICGKNSLILYVDKMSRVFFCLKDKIFSIQFPFSIQESSDGNIEIVHQSSIVLDAAITSALVAIFHNESIWSEPMDDFCTLIWEEIDSCGGGEYSLHWELIKFLMSFEPGYLRYDYDEEHQNGKMHPLNHLDLFYSSNNTFKIGLANRIDNEWFINFLDTNKECCFIS